MSRKGKDTPVSYGVDRKPDRTPYGKHEFHSIADQKRAEEKAFSKGRNKRKKK